MAINDQSLRTFLLSVVLPLLWLVHSYVRACRLRQKVKTKTISKHSSYASSTATSTSHPGMQRLSGLQKDVLTLYRHCLRAARAKPTETRQHFEAFARRRFEENLNLDKKDFGTIEFLLRKGRRQLEVYEAPHITNISG